MEDKPSELCDVELTKHQVETKDTLNVFGEERVSGDGEEEPAEANDFTKQLTAEKGDSLSLSSESSSENDSLRSKVPHVNCPEHIVSRNETVWTLQLYLCFGLKWNFIDFGLLYFMNAFVTLPDCPLE